MNGTIDGFWDLWTLDFPHFNSTDFEVTGDLIKIDYNVDIYNHDILFQWTRFYIHLMKGENAVRTFEIKEGNDRTKNFEGTLNIIVEPGVYNLYFQPAFRNEIESGTIIVWDYY